MLYGQFPTPGPPRSDLEDLLVRGGAVKFRDLKSIVETFQTDAPSNAALVRFVFIFLIYCLCAIDVAVCIYYIKDDYRLILMFFLGNYMF